MKVLLDSCVYGLAVTPIRDAGHDVEWCGTWPSDPGDTRVLAHAVEEGRVLVTLDKDFGELVIVRRLPHCGLIRLVNVAATSQGPTVVSILAEYADVLTRRGLIVFEYDRVRIRMQDE